MKRSEINKCIKEFEGLLKEHRFELPPFLSFTPEEWQEKGHEYDEIRDNALGWDIINRGGGNLVFKLWNATSDEKVDREKDVKIFSDGREYTVPAGSEIVLKPGQSMTLYPYYYHEFTIQPGTGYAIIGEVSMCNDDNTDNCFEEVQGRFPTIEEDEAPYRLLCNEYPPAKD